MLKRRAASAVPSPLARLALVDHASYVPDERSVGGMLFDERRGDHWHLNSDHFRIAMEIATDRGRSRFGDLVARLFDGITDSDVETVLAELWATGLFRTCECPPQRWVSDRAPEEVAAEERTDCPDARLRFRRGKRRPPRRRRRVGEQAGGSFPAWDADTFVPPRPPLALVIEFAAVNICFRVLLALRWWSIVAPIRLAQRPRSPASLMGDTVAPPPLIVEQMIAAARATFGVPGVDPRCVPLALTLHWMLRRRGYCSFLVEGTPSAPFTPHLWCEVDGYPVETLIYRCSNNRYQSCEDIRTHDDVMRACGAAGRDPLPG